jgi:hypothetical protein
VQTHGRAAGRIEADSNSTTGDRGDGDASGGGQKADGNAPQRDDPERQTAKRYPSTGNPAQCEKPIGNVANGKDCSRMPAPLTVFRIGAAGNFPQRKSPEAGARTPTNAPLTGLSGRRCTAVRSLRFVGSTVAHFAFQRANALFQALFILGGHGSIAPVTCFGNDLFGQRAPASPRGRLHDRAALQCDLQLLLDEVPRPHLASQVGDQNLCSLRPYQRPVRAFDLLL